MYRYGSITPVPLGYDGHAVGDHRADAAAAEVDGPTGEASTESDCGCDLVCGGDRVRVAVPAGGFPPWETVYGRFRR